MVAHTHGCVKIKLEENIMKKRLGLLLAAFLLATTATLVSCDSGEKNDNDPTNQTPPAVETPIEGNQFVVTFETSGGSIVAPITVKEGEKVTKPADPTKTGHLFAGWKKNGEVFDFETPITESITLTASWAKEKFTIMVNLNNGQDAITVENVSYGTKLSDVNISLENVDKEGYSLSGIMLGEIAVTGEELVVGNMTLDVIWTPREYSATIIRANGKEEAITFTADNKAIVLDNIRLTQSTSDYVYAWSRPLPMELELEDGAVFQEMQSISTVEQFLALNGQTGYYFLASDIDFGGQVFTSNSVPVESFAGTLEGNGYSVKNLTFKAADVPQQGVFKKLSGAIRNMGFENITMSGWMGMHGWSGIVAKNADGATLENIYISGSMELVNAVDYAWEGGNYTGWGLVSGFLASSADNATVNNVFCDVKYKSGTDISCVAGKGTVNLGDYIVNDEYGTLKNWGSYKDNNGWQGGFNRNAVEVMLEWPKDIWNYNGIGNPSLKKGCTMELS